MAAATDPLFAQRHSSYLYDNWRVADGLPQHSVNDIRQTPDGYLWLATEGGLVRFDGLSFTTFDRGNTPTIYSNRITSLAVDPAGHLYFGTVAGGIARYSKGVFEDLTDGLGIGRIPVRAVTVDALGRIWFSSNESGIFLLDGDQFKKVFNGVTLGPVPIALATFQKSRIVATYDRQLLEVTPDGAKVLHEIPEYENYYRYAISDYSGETVWVGTNHELVQYDGKSLERYPLPERHKNSVRMRLLQHPSLGVVVVTAEGIALFDTVLRRFVDSPPMLEALFDEHLNCLFLDRENFLWVGTATSGLYRVRENPFRLFESHGVLFESNSLSAFRTRDSTLWLGQIDGLVTRLSKNLISYTRQADIGGLNAILYTFLDDSADVVYAGSYADGVYKLKSMREVEVLPFSDGEMRWVYTLYPGDDGSIWAGTERGLFHLEGDRFSNHRFPEELKHHNVTFMHRDSEGKTWISTDRTVFSVHNGVWKDWRGVIPEKNKFFRGIVELPNRSMVIGTYGNGIVYIDPQSEKAVSITKEEGLADNVASYLIFDGNLWFTGNNGLTFLRYADLLAFVEGRNPRVNALLYSVSDGSPTGEFNGGNQNSGLKLHGNTYLFPSLNGFVEINFDLFRIEETAPAAIIESVVQGGQRWEAQSEISVDYSTDRIEFVFTSPNFSSAGKTKFRYRLLGAEPGWLEAGSARRISYTDLRPGKYTFQVTAGTSTGIWGGETASVDLHIIAPFYMTAWFNGLLSLLALGMFGFVVYAGVQRSNRRQRERSALMDVLPDLIFKLDTKGQFLEFYGNTSALTQDFSNISGRNVTEVLDANVASLVQQNMTTAYEMGRTQLFEYSTPAGDTAVEFYEGRIVPIDRETFLFIIRDITARKAADQALKDKEAMLQASLEQKQALIQQIEEQQKSQFLAIVEAQERERKRIALDLHDSIGQMLSSVKLNLSVAGQKDIDLDQSLVIVQNSQSMIDNITQEVRNISYNLLPSSLKRFGLITAIDEQIKRLGPADGLEVKFFHVTQNSRYPEIVETSLFRVFQEALNNSMKHADASEVSIQIVEHEQSVSMVIEDDGTGFDFAQAIAHTGGSGLKNIISRVNMIGGDIHFDTGTGAGGTTITIMVPLP